MHLGEQTNRFSDNNFYDIGRKVSGLRDKPCELM